MKRNNKWIACALAGILLVQSYHMAEATELVPSTGSVSENSAEEVVTEDDILSEEIALQSGVSENSVSENTAEIGMSSEDNGLQENTIEETVSENTIEETVSENTIEETVSENTTEETVSENTTEETVSENTTEETVSENTTEETVSENTTEEGGSENTTGSGNTLMNNDADAPMSGREAVPPAAPVIKKVVPKDTSAEICFTYLLDDGQAAQIQYEVLIRDEVKGRELPVVSGKEEGTLTITGYDGKLLNTFRIKGLTENKKYSVVLRAKYGDEGTPVSSAKKAFTTKKDMLATDGTMKIRYADMETLKNDRAKRPEEVPAAGVEMKTGESCALYAQVSRLMRAVETDKLKWTVTPVGEDSPKNGLKIKAAKSTYEAVLTAEKPGSYRVTATNTLSKEEAARFQVTVK